MSVREITGSYYTLTLTLTLSVGIVGHLGGVHHDVQPGVARGGEGLREVRVRVRVRVMVRVRARVRVRVRVSRAAAKASANCANPETVGLPEKSMPTTYLIKGMGRGRATCSGVGLGVPAQGKG